MVTFKIMGIFTPKEIKETKNGYVISGVIFNNDIPQICCKKIVDTYQELNPDNLSVYTVKIQVKEYAVQDTGEEIQYNALTVIDTKEV